MMGEEEGPRALAPRSPLTRWVFGKPLVTPLVSVLIGAVGGLFVLAAFYAWRTAEDDRDDYVELTLRRWLTSGRGAYNPLDQRRSTEARR